MSVQSKRQPELNKEAEENIRKIQKLHAVKSASPQKGSPMSQYEILHRLWREDKISDECVEVEIEMAIQSLTAETVRLKDFLNGVKYFHEIKKNSVK